MDSEQNYPVLSRNIAPKRAQAYGLGTKQKSQAACRFAGNAGPDHPAAAEALLQLGRNQPKYWKQVIAQFPAHPRTWKSFVFVETKLSATRVWGGKAINFAKPAIATAIGKTRP